MRAPVLVRERVHLHLHLHLRQRHRYIKDYDGATLMECAIDHSVSYLAIKRQAEQQRQAEQHPRIEMLV